MKRILFLLLVFTAIFFFGFRTVRENVRKDLAQNVTLPSSTPTPRVLKETHMTKETEVVRSVFIPYWGMKGDEPQEDYDSYLYFGISPAGSRVNTREDGYRNLSKFQNFTPKNAKSMLVLRMLDSDVTFPLLKDAAKQSFLIKDSIALAKEYGFSGIVLDLELSAVPFDSLIKQINGFTNLFYQESKNNKLEFSLMLYGDTFYRLRPFDVKVLSKNADQFMIMSYDFSKSRSNPGPNFPLRGKEVYGYDMTRMVDDFLKYLPAKKTTVVFGLFGYDWIVDDAGKAVSQGSPKTYLEIKKEFLDQCGYKDCDVKRKNDSTETEIHYRDEENKKHIIWFEDMESVRLKEKYLKERGIGNFSFWAYSYF